jgi:DNA-binding response OmpR family regulator
MAMAVATATVAPVTPSRVVVIDDDRRQATALARQLRSAGYRVNQFRALQFLAQLDAGSVKPPDLIVAEIVSRDLEGLSLVVELRKRLETPILIYTATRRLDDAPSALTLGADSIVRKPVDPAELAERIQALLRRAGPKDRGCRPAEGRQVRVGNLTLDPGRGRATLGEAPLHLTPIEFRLLFALASSPGQVVLHDDLARRVWGYPDAHTAPSISIHIQHLRAKFRRQLVSAPRIATVRRIGYTLIPI